MGLYETSREMLAAGVVSGKDITSEASVTKLMHLLGKCQNQRRCYKMSWHVDCRRNILIGRDCIKYFRNLRRRFRPTCKLNRERCRSGLTGPPGKRVYLKRVPGVRIPLSPQSQITPAACWRGFYFQMAEPGLPERRQ